MTSKRLDFGQFVKFSNGIQEIQNDYHYHLFLNQVRQDINSFKYELLDILKNNNMKVPDTKRGGLSKDVKKGRKSSASLKILYHPLKLVKSWRIRMTVNEVGSCYFLSHP